MVGPYSSGPNNGHPPPIVLKIRADKVVDIYFL